MKRALALILATLLASCGPGPITTESGGTDGRAVELMAEAPDGTRLWRFYTDARWVYFASTGAQWTRSCGKNCTRVEQVPAAPSETGSETGFEAGHGHAPDPLAGAAQ